MPNPELVESESDENVSSEEENGKGDLVGISSYERQRLERIEENRRRMEAMGLRKIAESVMGSARKSQKMRKEKRGKTKMGDEDEEYNPAQEDEAEGTSSSGEDGADDEFPSSDKTKAKRNSTDKKSSSSRKLEFDADFVDDDEAALMQAIALSLQCSSGSLDFTTDSATRDSKTTTDTANDDGNKTRKDLTHKKKRKTMANRLQMTEDEMLVHFFQFDETGKGGINFRDVQRLATAHNFTWSQKEMTDMITFFDGDGDGKIDLKEFRKILVRCNLLKGSGNDE